MNYTLTFDEELCAMIGAFKPEAYQRLARHRMLGIGESNIVSRRDSSVHAPMSSSIDNLLSQLK